MFIIKIIDYIDFFEKAGYTCIYMRLLLFVYKYSYLHLNTYGGFMKKGFTLAEVLITLGIIGVIAAITIPTIITKTRNKQLETSFRAGYSILTQAVSQFAQDEGVDYITPDMFPTRTLKAKLMKYFINPKDCGFGTEEGDCIMNTGEVDSDTIVYRTFNNKAYMNVCRLDDGQFILNNGFAVFIDNAYGVVLISIDTNGIDKKPNRWGYDLFTFHVSKDGLKPMGAEGTWATTLSYCSKTNTTINNGLTCTYQAVSNPNYFKNLP